MTMALPDHERGRIRAQPDNGRGNFLGIPGQTTFTRIFELA
jgi:hypothetical protein